MWPARFSCREGVDILGVPRLPPHGDAATTKQSDWRKWDDFLSVHGCGPPFVGMDDAEVWMVSEQMFGFQGLLYKFPPRIRKPQFGLFTYSFESWDWKSGRAEVEGIGCRVHEPTKRFVI